MPQPPLNPRTFGALLQVVEDLLGPQGCPWDKEQTPKTLTPYAIEEAHELVESIEAGNLDHYREELGDLMLQVILHSKINEKLGTFGLEDVVETLVTKLVRRHPHVFGDVRVSGSGEVLQNWAEIKKAEKATSGTSQPGHFNIPVSLPALQRGQKLGDKAKQESFDWPDWREVMGKLDEELEELHVELDALEQDKSAANLEKVKDELGDVFFVLCQLSRKLKLEAETVARQGNRKFETRFRKLLELCGQKGIQLKDLKDEEKEILWQQVKKSLGQRTR